MIVVSSCATLFNSNQTTISVIANKPVKVIHQKDTISRVDSIHQLVFERSKNDAKIQLISDSINKTILVGSIVSPTTYLNLYFGTWGIAGLIIDLHSNKGYSYPRKVYVDMGDTSANYRKRFLQQVPYNHALKITPLKLIGIINPGFEFSYEYRWNSQTTTQLMGGYLTRIMPAYITHPHAFDAIGFRVAAEQRYYIKKNAPFGLYVAAELDFLQSSKLRSNFYDREIIKDSIIESYQATYRINRTFVSTNLKIGWQEVYKRLLIDLYVGLGIRYLIVTTEGKPTDPITELHRTNVFYRLENDRSAGRFITGSAPLNIRVGYLF